MLFSLGSLPRLARAGFVLARAGVFSDIDPAILPPAARLPLALAKLLARRTVRPGLANLPAAISALGPSYVKLGQFLATRPDVVGAEVVRHLEFLQDRMAPFPRDVAVASVEAAFGQPLDAIFVSFSEPVAAASIAQVHKARVKDAEGERDVAVKVLRPGVERRFRRDLGDMYFAARLAERWIDDVRRLRPVEVNRHPWAAWSKWRWIFGWRPQRRRNSRKMSRRIKTSGCQKSIGTALRRKFSPSNGLTASPYLTFRR